MRVLGAYVRNVILFEAVMNLNFRNPLLSRLNQVRQTARRLRNQHGVRWQERERVISNNVSAQTNSNAKPEERNGAH